MCLQRRTIYTNAHRLYRNRYTPYEITTPCGECTECQQAKANEWKARTYYEYLDTTRQGGYCLWDRLSYSNENLPHLNKVEMHVPEKLDFTCFNREDITLFLKRLRSNLTAENYKIDKKLRYMIAGEYGEDEGSYTADNGRTREATLRPHYHMILFCTADIPPAQLSMHVKRAWKMGRTAGVEDEEDYFRTKGIIQGKENALDVADYIGKYCMKNQAFDKVANYKCKELIKFWYSVEHNTQDLEIIERESKKPQYRERKKKILRKVKTFHVQSEGYGKYALEAEGAIQEGSLLGMPDKHLVKWWQKLPTYYVRKLYYDYERNGKQITWYLTETGKAWKEKNLEKTIESYARKLSNFETWAQSEDFRQITIEHARNEIGIPDQSAWYRLNDMLYAYRNGRSWREYAEYIIYHKGRIWNGNKIPSPVWTIRANAKAGVEANRERDEPMYFNYNTTYDKDFFGEKIIGPEDLGDKWKGYRHPKGKEIPTKTFSKWYTINENSHEKWNDFDKLTETIDRINTYKEWNEARKEKIRRSCELSEKAKWKTLYKNIIKNGNKTMGEKPI